MSTDTSAGEPATTLTESEEKTWTAIAHFSGLLSFVGPLIVWLMYRDKSDVVGREAKASLNFQITVALAATVLYVSGGVLTLVLVGVVLLMIAPLVQLAGAIMAIVGGIKVGQNGSFRYPCTIRFIR